MPPKGPRHSKNRGDFLPYELDYIPDDLRKRAKSELFEDEDTRVNSLRLLRTMLKDERDLHWQDEELFLLSFLRARKYDVKRSLQLMKTFYTVMGKRSELYYNFNYEDVRRTIKANIVGFLPHRDSEGCAILVIYSPNWSPQICTVADGMRLLTCALVHANLSPATQVAGFKVIFDFGGIKLSHLPYVSPTYVWLFAEALQNCFPGRFRAVHMVNEGSFFSYFWILLKQILSKKLRERFHFHDKNIKKLHKYFSPSILPVEFEGDLPSFDTTEWGEKMNEKAEYFSHVFSHGYHKYKVKAEEKSSASRSQTTLK